MKDKKAIANEDKKAIKKKFGGNVTNKAKMIKKDVSKENQKSDVSTAMEAYSLASKSDSH
jgi:hypothetical protein